MFHVVGEIIKMKDIDLSIKKVELVLDRRILLSMLIVVGASIILSGCLSYIFSDSIFTALCGLVIGSTIGVLANYFILTSYKIVKKINIELSSEEGIEDIQTVMKID